MRPPALDLPRRAVDGQGNMQSRGCNQMSILLKTSAAFLLCTNIAHADVTPEDVWENLQASVKAAGQTLSVKSAKRDGDTLVVTGLVFGIPKNEAEASVSELRFVDAGNGTVDIIVPPEYPINMTLPPNEVREKPVDIAIIISQQDMAVTASGDPAKIQYDTTAENLKIKVNQIDGQDTAATNMMIEATLSDVAGRLITAQDGATDNNATAGGLALVVLAADLEDGSEVRLTAAMKDIAMSSSGTLMLDLANTDFISALAAGGKAASKITYGSSDFDIEFVKNSDTSAMKGTAQSGEIAAEMGSEGLNYALRQTGVNMAVTSPSLPFPNVSVALDESRMTLKAPIAKSDAPAPFAFQTQLTNLTFSDDLWAALDPKAALPHDPLNLNIDTDGMMVAAKGSQSPFAAQMQSLNLNKLLLSFAGAELSGSGAGSFDYGAGPIPNAAAKFDLKLLGANGLMDKLVASGFVATETLMMPRMMLAMIAQPGAGPDELLSTIEIKDKGVFANGQKLYDLP